MGISATFCTPLHTGYAQVRSWLAHERTACTAVLDAVAELYGIPVYEALSKSRSQYGVFARQMAWYILKTEAQLSYAAIARAFERDHTTIMYGVKKVAETVPKSERTEAVQAYYSHIHSANSNSNISF